MTAKGAVEEATEPHRKEIGTLSILVGISIFIVLTAIFTYKEHEYARLDRIGAVTHRNRIEIVEDRIRDAMVGNSARPLVIYYVGEDEWGDERLINWPHSIVHLLGWTREDIEDQGLDVIIPDELELDHSRQMLKALERPEDEQKTAILHKNAIHKDGSRIPVRITAWALGGGTRALAAYIDAEKDVEETPR